jgi:hypothetical protein
VIALGMQRDLFFECTSLKAPSSSLISVSSPQHLFGFFDGTAFLIRALRSLVQV